MFWKFLTVLYVLLFSLTTSVAVLRPLFASKENVPDESPTWRQKMFKKAFIAETCSSTRSSMLLSWILRLSGSSVESAS